MSREEPLSRREVLKRAGVTGLALATAGLGDTLTRAPAASAATPNMYRGVTLTLLAQGGTAYEPALVAWGKEFESATGAKIEFDFTPWESTMPKIQADLAAGTPRYDMLLNDIEFQYTIYPYLLPINDLDQEKNYDISGFLEPVYKYGEGIAGQKGVRYGIPLTSGVAFVIYRTDLIKGNVPGTWAGYFDLLKQNTGGGRYGSSFAGVPAQLVKLFLARYWSEGDALLTPDWKPLINSPKGVKALEMLAEQTSKYAPPGILAWDNPDAANAFTRGQVSIYEGWGSFIFPALNDPTKSQVVNKWSIGLYPEHGTGNFVQHNFVIFKRSQHQEAAFDFIAYATSPQKEKEIILKFKDIPARKTVFTDPEVVAQLPYVGRMAAALDRGRPFAPGCSYWLEMFLGLGDGLSTALSGKATPQQALNDVADKWTRLTRQNPLKFEYNE